MRLLKKIVPLFLIFVCGSLGLTACGTQTVDNIKILKNEDGHAPEISFSSPYEFKESQENIGKISEGKGAEIKKRSYQRLISNQYNPETGEKINNLEVLETFGLTEQYMSLNGPSRYELIAQALENAKVGSAFVFLSPSSERSDGAIVAFRVQDSTEDEETVKKWYEEDAQRSQELKQQEVDKIKVFSGEEVAEMKNNKSLPTVQFKDGKPAITIPEGVTAPEGLAIDVVDEGKGDVVKDTDTIKANYVLYRWKEPKEVVQSSYDAGEPIDISLGKGSIVGWKKGLAGQKVGSKVLLTVPPKLAYGTEAEAKANNMPEGTLVFLVEILAVNPPGSDDAKE